MYTQNIKIHTKEIDEGRELLIKTGYMASAIKFDGINPDWIIFYYIKMPVDWLVIWVDVKNRIFYK